MKPWYRTYLRVIGTFVWTNIVILDYVAVFARWRH
jgi:hypothetical protein